MIKAACKIALALSALALVACCSTPAFAAPIPLFSTGADASGNALVLGSTDPPYTVQAGAAAISSTVSASTTPSHTSSAARL